MSGETNICSAVYNDPALTFVDLGWAQFQQYANSAYMLVTANINDIGDFEIPLQQWNASFDVTGNLTPFVRPSRPELLAITPPPNETVPNAPSVAVSPITLAAAPDEPDELANLPQLVLPPTPEAFDAPRPGAAPEMVIPNAPEALVIIEPDAPILEPIELPTVPVVAITQFSELAPVFDAPVPSEQLDFVETAYQSGFLDQIRNYISDWLARGGLLPPAVAQQLWDRAVSRDDATALKRYQEARDQFSALGWEEPSGVLNARLREAQQDNQNSRSNINRDVFIQEETTAVENLKFCVQQGLQLEQTMLQAHLAVEQRKFELAVQTKQVAVAVFNARVSQFNAAVQAYNARIEAYRAYLDALRAQVDLYRGQVEAARVRGEINEQRVRIYAEQVRASLSRAEVYRAQVEGFKAVIDAERAKIDGYRGQVDAFRSSVEAYAAEWQGYGEQLRAQATKGQIYETLARVYATRISAWQTRGQVAIAENSAQLAAAELFLRQHESQIRVLGAKLEAARTLISAQSAHNEAQARMYEADARIETAVSDANARSYQAETERARADVELALRDAELQITQMTQRAGLLLRSMESRAQVSGQLASSAFAAMNFSAGISSSQSRSRACSTEFQYVGEIGDAGA